VFYVFNNEILFSVELILIYLGCWNSTPMKSTRRLNTAVNHTEFTFDLNSSSAFQKRLECSDTWIKYFRSFKKISAVEQYEQRVACALPEQ